MPTVAWQGWRLELPRRWDAVKLEGDYESGYALFADLHRPRLGLRWGKARGRRFDASGWAKQAMKEEVGSLAAQEARPVVPAGAAEPEQAWTGSLMFTEPEPPGRDVWVARSKVSGRTVELVYHSRRGEHMLADTVLPTLVDVPAAEPTPWSVFELSCIVPPGMQLERQQLNAGDLSLSFAGTGERRGADVTVRQVAVAQLALKRMPLDRWLLQQQRLQGKHYAPAGVSSDAMVQVGGEGGQRPLEGVKRRSRRRLRFGFMRWLPAERVTYALHDQVRDRLVLLDATDEQLLLDVAATVGWARIEKEKDAEE